MMSHFKMKKKKNLRDGWIDGEIDEVVGSLYLVLVIIQII